MQHEHMIQVNRVTSRGVTHGDVETLYLQQNNIYQQILLCGRLTSKEIFLKLTVVTIDSVIYVGE